MRAARPGWKEAGARADAALTPAGRRGGGVAMTNKTYVLQTSSGQEKHVRLLLDRMVDKEVVDERFYPTYLCERDITQAVLV